MIKTLSPHYKTIPWLSPESGTVPDFYTVNLYFWNGLKVDVPATPNYEFKRVNPLGRLDDSLIDISGYIDDLLGTSLIYHTFPTTSIQDSDNQVWVKTEVIYTIGGVAQPPQFVTTELAVKGYGYGMEGSNPSLPTNGVLASGTDAKVSRKGVFAINFLASETESTTINTVSENYTFNHTKTATTDSKGLVQTLRVECSEFGTDEYIDIEYNGNVVYTLLIEDEQRYTPKDIFFKNKEGQLSSITFFKKSVESLSVTNESYEGTYLQPVNGNHQFISYNTNGKEKFKMDSGFVSEANNDNFTQLFLSNKVWQYEDGVYIPLKLGSKTIEYKSRVNDRLLNYNVEFEYAFNKINNA